MNYRTLNSLNQPSVLLPGYIRNGHSNPERFIRRLLRSITPQPTRTTSHKAQNSRIIMALMKIAFSALVLLLTNTKCDQPLSSYLFMMIGYDLTLIIEQYLIKLAPQTLLDNSSRNSSQTQSGYFLNQSESDNRGLNDRTEPEEESGVDLQTSIHYGSVGSNSQSIEAYRAILLSGIQIFAIFYYAVIFIYGQIVYFDSSSDCSEMAPALTFLVGSFILVQYVTFVIPIVAVLCYSAVILIILYRFPDLLSSGPAPASEKAIKSLSSLKFSGGLLGDHECRICMGEYVEGENVTELKCNNLHHFHSECIKKWLRVNEVCPICRRKLSEMKA